jgi:hypothetical protein
MRVVFGLVREIKYQILQIRYFYRFKEFYDQGGELALHRAACLRSQHGFTVSPTGVKRNHYGTSRRVV